MLKKFRAFSQSLY